MLRQDTFRTGGLQLLLVCVTFHYQFYHQPLKSCSIKGDWMNVSLSSERPALFWFVIPFRHFSVTLTASASCEQRGQTYIYTPQKFHIMMLFVVICLINVFFFGFLFWFLDHFIAFRVMGKVMEPIPVANRRRQGTPHKRVISLSQGPT